MNLNAIHKYNMEHAKLKVPKLYEDSRCYRKEKDKECIFVLDSDVKFAKHKFKGIYR